MRSDSCGAVSNKMPGFLWGCPGPSFLGRWEMKHRHNSLDPLNSHPSHVQQHQWQFLWLVLILRSCVGLCVVNKVYAWQRQEVVQLNQNEIHIYSSSTSHLTVITESAVLRESAEQHTQLVAQYNFAHKWDLAWNRNKEMHQQTNFSTWSQEEL